nr:MAG TPA: hypothetical protein [Caudoviricetes sp.]
MVAEKAQKKNAPEVELGSVQLVQGVTPCENNTSITDFLTFARGVREICQKKLSSPDIGP